MKASARELAYLLNFENDDFPLVNDAMAKTAGYIFEMLNENTSNNKFDFTLDKLEIKEIKEKIERLPKYYILDQFLNLIDKIKKSDLALITKDKLAKNDGSKDIKQSVYYKLYQRVL
ncbi:hypothetical protein A2D65_08100 [Campylobacter coli]|nr:hypothetical protein [Campylobacter coli]